MKKIIFIVLLVASFFSYNIYYMIIRDGNLLQETNFIIEKGSTLKKVIKDMASQEIIDSPMIFEIVARSKNVDKKIKSGEYLFPAKISMIDVLQKLINGDVFYRKITLPEGLMTSQYLEILLENPYLSEDISVNVLEGEMLPETYSFSRGDTRDSIILQSKRAMEKVLNEVWLNKGQTNLKNKYEVLILASIIEKETAIAFERKTVASVFVNRLNIGMKLQTDPTVIYALTNGERELGRGLKKADMSVDNPYNTYVYKGLPPTPICNPSKESIEATLNPENTDFLYFVADGKGGHSFSRNYEDHKKRIKDWKKEISLSK